VKRTVTLAALLLAAVAASAAAQKDKAKVYKTPQECFDAGSAAFAKGDHKTWVGCLAPASQKELAAELGVKYALTRASLEGLKDRDRAAAVAKAHKPLFDVLDRHGLTAKALKGLEEGKDEKQRQKARQAVLDLLKDAEAFLVDFYEAVDRLEGLSKEKDGGTEELTDVKIDGDKATATVVRTVKGDDKGKDVVSKESMRFVKVDGGWRLARRFAPDAPKEDSKD
jgi:hypothetical protein